MPPGSGAHEYLQLRRAAAWDFEDPEPSGWWRHTIRGTTWGGVRTGDAQVGERCLLIGAGGEGADAHLETHVRVKPGTDYRLRAALRTTGLEPLGAQVFGTVYLGEFDYLRGDNQDLNDALRWHTSSPRLTGTSDGWRELAYAFRTDPATRMLRLAASLGNWGRSRGELCLDDVRLEETDPGAGDRAAGVHVLPAVAGTEMRRALAATPRSELRFDARIPPGGRLTFGAGLDESGRRLGGDGVVFEVDVEAGGRTVNLYSRHIRPDAGRWLDVRIPLETFAGREVTVVLRTLPSPRDAARADFAGDTAFWAEPRIAAAPGPRGGAPDVFLITVDTLRADHLGCYGYRRDTSPAIDALAADGVLYENAFTTVPRTGPGFASLLTGRYPAAHGVHSMLDRLAEGNVTLPERLREAGYRTAAQVTLNVPWRNSFDQGFDRFDDHYDDLVARGEKLADSAAHWVERHRGKRHRGERHRGEPLFHWLHLWDPHFTYAAPEPWERWFDPGFDGVFDLYERVRRKELTWGRIFFHNDLTPRQVEHAIARYDGEIRYADRAIGWFLDKLRSLGLYDDALIVFTSDHGESLGEHDFYFEHGEYLYDATLRIPLIIKLPGGRSGGRRVAATASILDVLPTVLAAAGVDAAAGLEGVDLARHLNAEKPPHPVLFAQSGRSFFPENPRREIDGLAGHWTSVRQGRTKLIHVPTRGGGVYELYDLEADPGETENLYRAGDPRAARLAAALERRRAVLLESRSGDRPAGERPDQREVRRLRALGYID